MPAVDLDDPARLGVVCNEREHGYLTPQRPRLVASVKISEVEEAKIVCVNEKQISVFRKFWNDGVKRASRSQKMRFVELVNDKTQRCLRVVCAKECLDLIMEITCIYPAFSDLTRPLQEF